MEMNMTDAFKIATRCYNRVFVSASLIIGRGEEHEGPILLGETTKGDIIGVDVFGVPKFLVAMMHVALAENPNIATAVLVMEGWVAKDPDKKIAKALQEGSLSVSELPDRGEAVVFSIRVGAKQFVAICYIDRAARNLEKGKLTDVEATDQHFEGRFIGDGKPAKHVKH